MLTCLTEASGSCNAESEVEDVDLEVLVESDDEAEGEVEEQQETVFPVKFVPALLQVRAFPVQGASAKPFA